MSQRSLTRPDFGIASAGCQCVAASLGTPCLGKVPALASRSGLLRFVLYSSDRPALLLGEDRAGVSWAGRVLLPTLQPRTLRTLRWSVRGSWSCQSSSDAKLSSISSCRCDTDDGEGDERGLPRLQ